MHFSFFTILSQALRGNVGWRPHWRDAVPRPAYDIVIIGGGGHGLATAYYLAKIHGITNIAVLEKGLIGSGNAGRNTTIIRSNYLLPGNVPFYELSMRLWEGLEQDINYNVMVSQRGVLNLYHFDAQRDAYARRGNALRLHGVDAELLTRDQVREMIPFLDYENARFPIRGGLLQRRGGTVRHDAVAWGYARAASDRGVEIVQHCEVTGFIFEGGRVVGVETARGAIHAKKIGMVVAGSSSRLAALAGLRLSERNAQAKPCAPAIRFAIWMLRWRFVIRFFSIRMERVSMANRAVLSLWRHRSAWNGIAVAGTIGCEHGSELASRPWRRLEPL